MRIDDSTHHDYFDSNSRSSQNQVHVHCCDVLILKASMQQKYLDLESGSPTRTLKGAHDTAFPHLITNSRNHDGNPDSVGSPPMTMH